MVQLHINSTIESSPELRRHIEENTSEIELALPESSQVKVHLQKSAKNVYAAHLRTRLLGKMLVAKAEDSNLFQAINHARRQLLRQIEEVRSRHREQQRSRLRNAHERALGFRHLMPVKA